MVPQTSTQNILLTSQVTYATDGPRTPTGFMLNGLAVQSNGTHTADSTPDYIAMVPGLPDSTSFPLSAAHIAPDYTLFGARIAAMPTFLFAYVALSKMP